MMRIVIIDDHPIFRSGLRRVLEDYGHEVVAECGDARSGLAAIGRLGPELALVDLQMPGGGGLTVLKTLRGHPPVVVLTVSEDASDMEAAIEVGAGAYLSKSTEPAELVRILETVAKGYCVFPKMTSAEHGGRPRLSARQQSVLDGLVRGQTLKEIAHDLGISQFTIRTYQERLLEKFGVKTRAELIFAASGRIPRNENESE